MDRKVFREEEKKQDKRRKKFLVTTIAIMILLCLLVIYIDSKRTIELTVISTDYTVLSEENPNLETSES